MPRLAEEYRQSPTGPGLLEKLLAAERRGNLVLRRLRNERAQPSRVVETPQRSLATFRSLLGMPKR